MWNPPTKKQLALIPPLYSQENEEDPKVYMKFWIGGWTWYVLEFDGKDTFFGFVVSPSEPNGSLGYFLLSDLLKARAPPGIEVDRELHGVTPRSPKRLSELKRSDM